MIIFENSKKSHFSQKKIILDLHDSNMLNILDAYKRKASIGFPEDALNENYKTENF